ncbi:hypothetical protein GQ53DRAFT_824415 [Thozetella sp. PMI_491]|nr:hypothetical protein GQ53DRAFT_824415 [Thozetella sp. PMI_491]
MSAIASLVARRTSETYLAGLWKETLHFDLLWGPQDASEPYHVYGQRPAVWRGPSWSWVSLEAAIRFDVREKMERDSRDRRQRKEYYRSAITFLDSEIVLSETNNSFGRVEKAALTISGTVKEPFYYNQPLPNDPQNSHRGEVKQPLFSVSLGDDKVIGDEYQQDDQPAEIIGFLFSDLEPGHESPKDGRRIVTCLKTLNMDSEVAPWEAAFTNCVILERINHESAGKGGVYI